ncbi:MAG: SDR family oxidoreductase [Planctomycetes bacterium]|nr:SDR family oxidoreductase [Planctomycetota bacterium]
MAKLVIGCGYLGLRAARRWLAAGEQVFAVTRSQNRAKDLAELGLHPLVADVPDPATLADLPRVETLLYAVGYDRACGKPRTQVYVDGLQNVLFALAAETRRIIYISSTGVYGQTEGEWVDEDSPCFPTREGGAACLEAERRLKHHSLGSRSIILRMGGLYGPGRIPRRADVAAGRPIASPEHGYLNLIHIDDAVGVALAAEQAPAPNLYMVTDGQPVLRGDYFRELARLSDAPPPTFAAPAEDSPRAQRAGSDKRVSNRKMMAELGVTLRYPSYREGLAAIAAGE